MSTSHIRPKVRKAPKQKQSTPAEVDAEDVRTKLENWMGIGDGPPRNPNASETMFPSTIQIPSVDEAKHSNSQDNEASGEDSTSAKQEQLLKAPKGILKKPKYSKPVDGPVQRDEVSPQPSKTQQKQSIFKQDRIQERLPSAPDQQTQLAISPMDAAMAVEGYQPKMDHNVRIKSHSTNFEKSGTNESNKEDGGEPLIFNSLADMMQAAGTLPPQDLDKDPKVVEAELAFSCMTQDDYRTGLILQGMEQQEKEGQVNVDNTPEWKKPSFEATEYSGNNPVTDDETAEDEYLEEDDDGVFGLLGDDDDDDESDAPIAAPRTFRILWECLSPLITHESCIFLRRLKREQEMGSSYLITTTPLSELEGSRANGFLSMLRLYMSRALKELDQPVEMRRTAEQRLQGLLYTFNFSRPAAKLETKQWKALTCILLEMVLFLDQHSNEEGESPPPPPSATAVEMTSEEYRYLVSNTIKTFDIPGPVI